MKRYINWISLKIFGKNKFVLNTTLFLFLTPLIFKLKVFIEQAVSKYLDTNITIEIPFTWQLLFYSATLFGIGTLLFRLFYPKLIYQYSNLGEYEDSGKYIRQLYPYIEEIETKSNLSRYFDTELLINIKYKGQLRENFEFLSPVEDLESLRGIFHTYSEYHYLNKLQFTFVKDNPVKIREKHQFLNLHFKNLFDEVFTSLNVKQKSIRYAIATLYAIGSGLVAVTIIENLLFVLKHSFLN